MRTSQAMAKRGLVAYAFGDYDLTKPGETVAKQLNDQAKAARSRIRGKVAHESDDRGATRNRHYRIIHLKAEGLIEQTVAEARRQVELDPIPFD